MPNEVKPRSPIKYLEKDLKTDCGSPTVLCQTPKISKKEAALRRRLLVSTAAAEGKTGNTKTLTCRPATSSGRAENVCASGSFDSPDARQFEALATSTLKADELASLWRKRRLVFSKAKTSMLEDGKQGAVETMVSALSHQVTELGHGTAETAFSESIVSSPSGCLGSDLPESPYCTRLTPSLKGSFRTPVKHLSTPLRTLSTPSLTPLSDLDVSAGDDSGFSTLALDRSRDSFVDHDGSFQELLLQPASGCKETPSLAESNRRARLKQQRRLSMLREGGSQLEEEPAILKSTSVHLKLQLETEAPLIVGEGTELFLVKTPLRTTAVAFEDLSLTPALQMVHNMCQQSARMLSEQASLEELLMSSEGIQPLQTTMPLRGLIGRKMGLKRLDVLEELKERNLRHILAKILNLLSSEDIFRFGQVSNVWNEIIVQDKRTSQRRRSYLYEQKLAFELGSAAHVPDAETRLNLLSRSALRSVQAQSKTPSSHPPLSGNDSSTPGKHSTKHSASKRDGFLQVAKTLFSDECLRACPRCHHPARCHLVKREGVCTWEDCAFQFCTGCLCAYHGSKECGSWSAKRHSRTEVLAGSSQSKRNLQRL
ncbi:F-box only protein 43 [Megalops cyprinoides]|uniref:F-box only protein 43 n=1 Tax=Megalops cyprinoides TaxID=118141 RepID=UPI0018642666|nr:F-box only protein 43 [Megalops cyprinoides]